MKKNAWPMLIAALGLTYLGWALFRVGLFGLKTEWEQNSWTHAISTVVQTQEVKEYQGTKSGWNWCPVWTSEYWVDGQEHRTSQRSFGAGACFKSLQEADAHLYSHPVGSELGVIFEPGNPDHAVIEIPEEKSKFRWPFNGFGLAVIIGAALILFAVSGMVSNVRKFRAESQA
jgi:hypothetical protein